MQIQQNTKAPKYKYSKIQKYTKQMGQNAKKNTKEQSKNVSKHKWNKIQN